MKEEIPLLPSVLDNPDFREAWAEWIAYRKESGLKPWIPRTVKAQIDSLATMGSAGAIAAIRGSIASGWKGIYPAKPIQAKKAQGGAFFK